MPAQLKQLLDEPAIHPPAGATPSLDSPPNIDTVCYLTFSLCVGFASLAVAIRIYTKHFIIHSIAYDDCEFENFVADVSPILTIPDACMIGLVRIQPDQLKRLLPLTLTLPDRPMGAVRSVHVRSTKWCGSPCMGLATQCLLQSSLRMATYHDVSDFTDRAVSGLTPLCSSTLPTSSLSSFLSCFSTSGSSSLTAKPTYHSSSQSKSASGVSSRSPSSISS